MYFCHSVICNGFHMHLEMLGVQSRIFPSKKHNQDYYFFFLRTKAEDRATWPSVCICCGFDPAPTDVNNESPIDMSSAESGLWRPEVTFSQVPKRLNVISRASKLPGKPMGLRLLSPFENCCP